VVRLESSWDFEIQVTGRLTRPLTTRDLDRLMAAEERLRREILHELGQELTGLSCDLTLDISGPCADQGDRLMKSVPVANMASGIPGGDP